MTIQFSSNADAKRFFAKCMYTGNGRDAMPVFAELKLWFNISQVTVNTWMDIPQVKKMLVSNKVKFDWITEY